MVKPVRPTAVIALATGLLLALPAPAPADPFRPQLGIEGGANYGSMSQSDFGLGDPQWSFGGEAGLVARWEPFHDWGIEAAPGWERWVGGRAGTFSLSSGGSLLISADFDLPIRFDRIALPIRAVFHPGTTGWSLEGGLSGSWLAHARGEVNLSSVVYSGLLAMASRRTATPNANIFQQVGASDPNDWTDSFQRWEMSAVAGAGWDHPVAEHTLRLRARWQQGLTDIGKNDSTIKLYGASATVGWLW